MIRALLAAATCLALALALGGCGQKGPLRHPGTPETTSRAP